MQQVYVNVAVPEKLMPAELTRFCKSAVWATAAKEAIQHAKAHGAKKYVGLQLPQTGVERAWYLTVGKVKARCVVQWQQSPYPMFMGRVDLAWELPQ